MYLPPYVSQFFQVPSSLDDCTKLSSCIIKEAGTTAGEKGPWLEHTGLSGFCSQHEESSLACLSLTLPVEVGEMIILAFFSLWGWS